MTWGEVLSTDLSTFAYLYYEVSVSQVLETENGSLDQDNCKHQNICNLCYSSLLLIRFMDFLPVIFSLGSRKLLTCWIHVFHFSGLQNTKWLSALQNACFGAYHLSASSPIQKITWSIKHRLVFQKNFCRPRGDIDSNALEGQTTSCHLWYWELLIS